MIEWKIKGLYKANAETIYNEIMSIGETVRPSDVVELARDENTALHNHYLPIAFPKETVLGIMQCAGQFIGIGARRKEGYGRYELAEVREID